MNITLWVTAKINSKYQDQCADNCPFLCYSGTPGGTDYDSWCRAFNKDLRIVQMTPYPPVMRRCRQCVRYGGW